MRQEADDQRRLSRRRQPERPDRRPPWPQLLQERLGFWRTRPLRREVIPERRCTPRAPAPTARSRSPHDITKYTRARSSRRSARRLSCTPAFTTVAGERRCRPTPSATSVASPSVLHRGRQTGTWSATTRGLLPARPASSSPTSTTPFSATRAPNLRKCQEQMGFLDPRCRRRCTRSPTSCRIRHPATYRHMHGFASHTFSFINAQTRRMGQVPLQVTAGSGT